MILFLHALLVSNAAHTNRTLQFKPRSSLSNDVSSHQFRPRSSMTYGINQFTTPYVPPSKKDYEILFQLLFDEYCNRLPRAISPDPVAVAAPRAVDPANPSSEETTLQGVIPSNLHHLNQSFDTLAKLKKNHPLENVIGDPSRPVSTRSQLQEQAIWCYFDANDNPIPFGGKRSG
ncbi:hypothetical protein Tco_0404266 [Tanacetum coccineum]